MPADFPGAFAGLRKILSKHAAGMLVHVDTPVDYTVITRAHGPNKKPLFFGAVYSKKSAVSFHLLPLYYNPRLHATLGPELKARMQGKACFNFQRPDAKLFAELDELVATARDQWKRAGFLEPGVIARERFTAVLKASGGDVGAMEARRQAVLAQRAATKKKATAQRKQSRS